MTACLFPFTAKLLERPVYTRCLPSSPPIFSSTHCFLTCSAPSNGSHSDQPCPWHAGRNLVGSAGEPDGRGRRSPRRSATLHPAFLPDARLVSRAQRCASPLLPGSGRRRHLESSTEETSTRDPAPSGFQTPPQPRGHPARVPAGQAGPKDSGPGPPPARRGAPSRPLLA
ncbi:uncharacterized protein LOC109274560 isoform X3 [Panthera pardus]|uniref:Uncharacterized protein LOC109274560 isoform X3 n=1 Tax=Panthera pardus TaxID=9691 RepID=A0A9W2UHE9_PANPR|nr:uncharacterized protein LOC109274560 isoform X3 [Panthera pardus]